jgi:hypothetical protein
MKAKEGRQHSCVWPTLVERARARRLVEAPRRKGLSALSGWSCSKSQSRAVGQESQKSCSGWCHGRVGVNSKACMTAGSSCWVTNGGFLPARVRLQACDSRTSRHAQRCAAPDGTPTADARVLPCRAHVPWWHLHALPVSCGHTRQCSVGPRTTPHAHCVRPLCRSAPQHAPPPPAPTRTPHRAAAQPCAHAL